MICLRKNKKLEIDTKNNYTLPQRNKRLNLYLLNNKSSNCITPGSFNPWINYKLEEKKYKNGIRNEKNKDHFFHMNPTEIYIYRPLLKRVFNSSSFSKKEKNNKKTGKKLFSSKNKESTEQNNNKNKFKYRYRYLNINTNNFFNNKPKIYEYDAPIITYKDVNKIF